MQFHWIVRSVCCYIAEDQSIVRQGSSIAHFVQTLITDVFQDFSNSIPGVVITGPCIGFPRLNKALLPGPGESRMAFGAIALSSATVSSSFLRTTCSHSKLPKYCKTGCHSSAFWLCKRVVEPKSSISLQLADFPHTTHERTSG